MGRFYFIPSLFLPNTAATNRWLAYLRYFSEKGIETNVVFFRPNKNFLNIEKLPHIQVINYSCHFYIKIQGLEYLSYLLYYIHFWFSLKPKDVLYCYEQVDVWKLFLKKGVRVFAEYTEHPNVVGLGGKFFHTSKKQFNKLCKRLDGLFVISSKLKQYFIEEGVLKNKVHIIHIIVDTNRFNGLKKDSSIEPYIAYCGTASNNKDGVDDLIRAFSIFNKLYPKVKLLIIGETPSQNDEAGNKKLIKELGLTNSVIFSGIVDSSKIPQLLKDARLLALGRPRNIQSDYGFPTKLGEYLLSENPVVVTRVGDIPHFLTDGISALLAEPNNPIDFANKLIWSFSHQEQSELIGKRGAEIARDYFDYYTETEKMAHFMALV